MKKLTTTLLTIFTALMLTSFARAADPGIAIPASSAESDQKAGSVLFYNLYTSNPTDPRRPETAISITNTSFTQPAMLHLFFVAGMGSAADGFICLTPSQTVSFLASEQDPFVTGYLVAVAVNEYGCPVNQNTLIGSAYVRMVTSAGDPSVYEARLNAEAFAAIAPPVCNKASSSVTLRFDGVQYNHAPRTLVLDAVRNAPEGNSALVILNSVDGNLAVAGTPISLIQGVIFDDMENLASFQFTPAKQQFINVLSNSFPRTTPRFQTIIPPGHTGWIKFWMMADRGMLGAVINLNPLDGAKPGVFNGGSNLHRLSLSASSSITIPVFPPTC